MPTPPPLNPPTSSDGTPLPRIVIMTLKQMLVMGALEGKDAKSGLLPDQGGGLIVSEVPTSPWPPQNIKLSTYSCCSPQPK